MRTATYYPRMPGETLDAYTDRLTGADKTAQCSDPGGGRCKCPCHTRLANASPYGRRTTPQTSPAGPSRPRIAP